MSNLRERRAQTAERIAELIRAGNTNAQIAERLGVSVWTAQRVRKQFKSGGCQPVTAGAQAPPARTDAAGSSEARHASS